MHFQKEGGERMAKKKKYIVRNQFRYSKSREAGYHPHYIFGEKGDRYISLGMTTHPPRGSKVSKIKSPNPDYHGDQFVQHKIFTMKKTSFANKRKNGWSFHADDLPLIRHFKKKYKRGK